jgi:tol-pal system protein YbgF
MRLMVKKTLVAVSVTLVVILPSLTLAGEAEVALQQRVERLERIIQGQGLVSLLSRVDQLQNEVQRLNGDNETLNHKLDEMQQRQRELYIDLDERLQAQAVVSQDVASQQQTTDAQQIAVDDISPPTDEGTGAENQATETAQATLDSPEMTTPVAVENGEAAYQAALQTLRSGQYEQAAAALVAFPEQYPHSSYLPNAFYWQGEANYVLRNFDQAIVAFQTVIDRFPASSKVADAMLKQGFSQYELDQVDAAKATLTTVMQQYPNTSASRLAKVRLDRIKQQSN